MGVFGIVALGYPTAKKMLASKIKRTYFENANNSTPFFALVMPSGITRNIVLLNRSFKGTSPVYDKIGKQIESQSGQNLCELDLHLLRFCVIKRQQNLVVRLFESLSDRFF
jgi:hypothetical protein